MVSFQREIYETNFPGFLADQRFLREYGEQIRRSLGSPAEGLFVLEADRRACGFLWLSLVSTMVDPCVGYIRNIYVAPELRRQGYCRQLMAFAEHWCRCRGARTVALDASFCNQRAVGIYRQAGFQMVRVRMEKRLDGDAAAVEERAEAAHHGSQWDFPGMDCRPDGSVTDG